MADRPRESPDEHSKTGADQRSALDHSDTSTRASATMAPPQGSPAKARLATTCRENLAWKKRPEGGWLRASLKAGYFTVVGITSMTFLFAYSLGVSYRGLRFLADYQTSSMMVISCEK